MTKVFLGTDWQNNSQFDPVLLEQIQYWKERGYEVVVEKIDHFDRDGRFEQWSKDYYVLTM